MATRAALVLALAGALAVGGPGCVTVEGVVMREQTTLPWLVAGAAGDLVVVGVVGHEAANLSIAGAIATALALTAVDVFVGCLLGACSSLKL